MGTKEKLIERFLTLPKDFTYDEVKRRNILTLCTNLIRQISSKDMY